MSVLSMIGRCSRDADCPSGFQCAGVRQCVRANVHYHAAVEPTLRFDRTAFVWRLDTSANTTAPIWAEANWADDIGVRVYAREREAHAWATLVGGALATLVTAVVARTSQRYCRRRLKMA